MTIPPFTVVSGPAPYLPRANVELIEAGAPHG